MNKFNKILSFIIILSILYLIKGDNEFKCPKNEEELKRYAVLNITIYSKSEITQNFKSRLQFEMNINNKLGIYIFLNIKVIKQFETEPLDNQYYILFLEDYIKINKKNISMIYTASQVYIDKNEYVFASPAVVYHGNTSIRHLPNVISSELKTIVKFPIKYLNYSTPEITHLSKFKFIPSFDSKIIINSKCGIIYNNTLINPNSLDLDDIKLEILDYNKCNIVYNLNVPIYDLVSNFRPKYVLNRIKLINFTIFFKIYLTDRKLELLIIESIAEINKNALNFKIDYIFVNSYSLSNIKISTNHQSDFVLGQAINTIFVSNPLEIILNTKYGISIDTVLHEFMHILGFSHSNEGIMSSFHTPDLLNPILINICPNIYYLKNDCSYDLNISENKTLISQYFKLQVNYDGYSFVNLNTNNTDIYKYINDILLSYSSNIKNIPIKAFSNIDDAFDNNNKVKLINDPCIFKYIPQVTNIYYLQNMYCTLVIQVECKLSERYYLNLGALNGCYNIANTDAISSVICCSRGMKLGEIDEIK
jgi:hypothetical protein